MKPGDIVHVCLTCVEKPDGSIRVFPRCVAVEPHRLESLPGEVAHNWVSTFLGVDMKTGIVGLTLPAPEEKT